LTVLGRAADRAPHLAGVIADLLAAAGTRAATSALVVATRLEQPQPVLDALRTFVAAADLDSIRRLNAALPVFSLVLARTSADIAQTLVERNRELTASDRGAYLPDLAGSVNNLAIYLAEVGRRPEALAAAQEAVALYNEAVEKYGPVFADDAQRSQEVLDTLA